MIVDAFRGVKFATDEKGEPKIRYRFLGNHAEVLLFFETKEDATRAILQGPILIDGCAAGQLSIAEDQESGVLDLFTGQRISFGEGAPNLEVISCHKGLVGFSNLCPVMDLTSFLER
jgi:hypothetical protein